jgi:hypothetical protein
MYFCNFPIDMNIPEKEVYQNKIKIQKLYLQIWNTNLVVIIQPVTVKIYVSQIKGNNCKEN